MKILIITQHTVKEALRKRIILAGVVLTALFLLLYGTGVHFGLSSIQGSPASGAPGGIISAKAMRDFEAGLFLFMGMFAANMAGALAAVFTSSGAIASEVEQGTLQSFVTRPISRRQLILGKWLGYAILLTLYLGIFFSSLVLIVYGQSGWLPDNVFPAGAAFVLETLVVLSVTIFGSTFMPATANAVVAVMLFMTALIGGIMEQIGVFIGKQALFTTGIITGIIMPTDSLYRYAVGLLQPKPGKLTALISSQAGNIGPFGSASPPSVWMLLYSLLFCFGLITAAIAVFSRRDL